MKIACEAVRDYISGPYISEVPVEMREYYLASEAAIVWFDFVRTEMFAVAHD